MAAIRADMSLLATFNFPALSRVKSYKRPSNEFGFSCLLPNFSSRLSPVPATILMTSVKLVEATNTASLCIFSSIAADSSKLSRLGMGLVSCNSRLFRLGEANNPWGTTTLSCIEGAVSGTVGGAGGIIALAGTKTSESPWVEPSEGITEFPVFDTHRKSPVAKAPWNSSEPAKLIQFR
ncbi:MAG: hypothetical protein LBV12_12240 [Puniceicoccales bacterium]|nr:hypothetical protein [Puniceicoccales bacterium]